MSPCAVPRNLLPCSPRPLLLKQYVVEELNAVLWAALIIVTGLLLARVGKLVRFWATGRRLPGPPFAAFAKARGRDNFSAFLAQSHREYGSVVRVWLGPNQLLVSVTDPEIIRDVLLRAEDRLPLAAKAFQLAFGKCSLFVSSFAQVQKRRCSLERQLNWKMLEKVHSISLKVVENIKKSVDVRTSKLELDCISISQHMAFSVLGATLFGDGFLVWPSAREYEDLLLLIAKEACFWATYTILPIWNKHFQRYRDMCARLQKLTEQMVKEGKQQKHNLDSSQHASYPEACDAGIAAEYEGTCVEFAEDLISGILFSEDSSRNSAEEPYGNIMAMMFHGCLTTAGIISGVLARLAQHPEIQAKVCAEINTTCCKSALPSISDVQKMHYLVATIHESARLLPAGPLLQRCSLKHDLKLRKDLTIPAGAILAVPLQLVQMDSSNWGNDSDIFNPERFLRQERIGVKPAEGDVQQTASEGTNQLKNSKVEDSRMTFEDPVANVSFLAFGFGSRVCVGKRFAIVGMATLLASLLQYYEIRLDPGAVKDPKPKIENCVLQFFPSPKLSLVPRDC